MKDSLATGLTHRLEFTVPHGKTVPHLYPESDIYRGMPAVFATGFMVGLFEWACVELLRPHLEEGEGSLGTHIDVSHEAATPPGFTVLTDARLVEIDGRRLVFEVEAHDGVDLIGRGHHERTVVKWSRFNEKLALKADGQTG
jgi:fluoroacetyl-CoA thioesterase